MIREKKTNCIYCNGINCLFEAKRPKNLSFFYSFSLRRHCDTFFLLYLSKIPVYCNIGGDTRPTSIYQLHYHDDKSISYKFERIFDRQKHIEYWIVWHSLSFFSPSHTQYISEVLYICFAPGQYGWKQASNEGEDNAQERPMKTKRKINRKTISTKIYVQYKLHLWQTNW